MRLDKYQLLGLNSSSGVANPGINAANTKNAAISSGTSATVTSVGSVPAGHLMIVVLMVGGATLPASFTAPDGTWTTFLTTTSNQSASPLVATAIFYKEQTTAGSFSGSFGWTNTATSGHWLFMEFSGLGASLVDGTVATSLNASGTKTSPTITPTAGLVNDTLICGTFAGVVGTDTLTVPSGMSSILTVAGTAAIPFFGVASLALASASATGTKTWTIPTSRTNLGVSFLIQQGNWSQGGQALTATRHPTVHEILPLLRQQAFAEPPRVVETNTNFLGRFKAPIYSRVPATTIWTPSDQPPAATEAANISVVIYDEPRASRVRSTLLYYWHRDTTVPTVAAVETNRNFIGRFKAPIYSRFSYNGQAIDLPAVAQAETNTNFIGRFTASKHTRFNYNLSPGDVPPQPETNTNFLGRFKAPVYARWGYGLHHDTGVPVVETNPHWLGRYTVPRHAILPALRQNEASPPPISETNQHWLGRFTRPTHARFNYNVPAADVPPQPETNVHFVGRFAPSKHAILALLRQSAALDSPPQAETNTNFIGRFSAPRHAIIRGLRQNDAPPPPVAETNTNFLGRFIPPKYTRLARTTEDTAVPAVETNPHWIGRFTAPKHSRLALLRQAGDVSAPAVVAVEANPHFIGSYLPTQHWLLIGLRQAGGSDSVQIGEAADITVIAYDVPRPSRVRATMLYYWHHAVDGSAVAQAETNTNFLGRFSAPHHVIRPALHQNEASPPPVAETSVSFRGRFAITRHTILASLRQARAIDVTPQAETNQHWLGRHVVPRHAKLPPLRQNEARDFPPAVETNTNFIGRFTAPRHAVRPALRQNEASAPRIVETNPHWIGRYAVPAHHIIARLRQAEALDRPPPAIETNPHFIGRFRPPHHICLPGLRQNIPNDIVFTASIIEAADAVDVVSVTFIPPQPCPCEPIDGDGPGTNPSIGGPGPGANLLIGGGGPTSNPQIPGGGPCDC